MLDISTMIVGVKGKLYSHLKFGGDYVLKKKYREKE